MKIGGIFYLKKDNKLLVTTEGEFTFNLGKPKRQAEKNGALGVAGFSAEAQVPYVDGEIYDLESLDVEDLLDTENATIVLELYNGKTFFLYSAYFCGEGENTTKGRLKVRVEGMGADIKND